MLTVSEKSYGIRHNGVTVSVQKWDSHKLPVLATLCELGTEGGNMKRVTRKQMRGKPLDPLCKKAHTTTNEYGLEDKRVFCCGVWEAITEEPVEMCRVCKAFVRNEEPLKEET